MRCLLCERWSWQLLCKECQQTLLTPTISKRTLFPDFEVISFYPYSEIKDLLHTKHTYIGAAIYRILSKIAIKPYVDRMEGSGYLIPIDDRVVEGYSHTAVMAQAAKSDRFVPRYGVLRARNRVNYSGKSLKFRLENPRDFIYKGPKAPIVLIDDIITTGTTLKEAYSVCKSVGAEPVEALVLADAKE